MSRRFKGCLPREGGGRPMGSSRKAHSWSMAAVRQRLERWRQQGRRGGRIPEALWGAAVELAREHGVSATARDLGLAYYSLKERLEAASDSTGGAAAEPRGAEFLEIPLGVLGGGSECKVEFESGDGVRLRVELSGAGLERLPALVRELRGAGG